MDYMYEPKEMERLRAARESFSGRPLSDAQFDNMIAITGILKRRIERTGAFVDDLRDFAYAVARTEGIEPMRAETIIRDLFKARTGQTMNHMRERLAERESKLTKAQTGLAYDFALATGKMIEDGDKISFNRAFNHQAAQLARELGITDAGAKRLMKEEFKAAEADLDFYEWGKDIEERFYRPQIEAERQQRERSQDRETGRERSRSRENDSEGPNSREEGSGRQRSRSPDEPARRENLRSRQRMDYQR